MGENTKIEWAHHTFNPWRGCTKVSKGCDNCYAEKMSGRNPNVFGVWGKHGTRVIASDAMWREPLNWNRAAEQAGERHRVFCASLADVFEGNETLPDYTYHSILAARQRLFRLIVDTPHLDWLLLTKRPQNVEAVLKQAFPSFAGLDVSRANPFIDAWLDRVWLGTSVEDQKTADERIPHLLNTSAAVRFLSIEPLLGPVEFSGDWWCEACQSRLSGGRVTFEERCDSDGSKVVWASVLGKQPEGDSGIDWVIVGGESGPNARPMHPDWVRSIRDQCQSADVPFFFKQWGEYAPNWLNDDEGHKIEGSEWSDRMGKKHAGRLLDGREWNEIPEEQI